MEYDILTAQTTPYDDQCPGTSGLRKKTKRFMQPNYTENFIQSVLSTISGRIELGRCTIVVGGDGRFFNRQVIDKYILPMLAANGVWQAIVGQKGILSTPAASHLIRLNGADGGIILTASHNPGGEDEDFGIKFNMSNGGPSPEKVTRAIFEYSKTIKSYKTLTNTLDMDISVIQKKEFSIANQSHPFKLIVVDPTKAYRSYMKKIFDLPSISKMLTGEDGFHPFSVAVDAMSGVMGPYVHSIMGDLLKVPKEHLFNCEPLPDFGKKHPDPNLTYAKGLVNLMTVNHYDFGCAFDGDGDRNMILGSNAFFVNPSDSLAVIANNLKIIPYFKRKGVHGLSRSMPTSGAVDRVAINKGLTIYEVPTGWKFFGNLMDNNQLSLCGEESFGMGSCHIREKDGLWCVLAWLSVVAHFRRQFKKTYGVNNIVEQHWYLFGRNFYTRYDYEGLSSENGEEIQNNLRRMISQPVDSSVTYHIDGKDISISYWDDFSYYDSIDESTINNQGIRLLFSDSSRIIYRLSGTGSSGATLRIYVESYENDRDKILTDAQIRLKPLVNIALSFCKVHEITGRTEPTVIT